MVVVVTVAALIYALNAQLRETEEGRKAYRKAVKAITEGANDALRLTTWSPIEKLDQYQRLLRLLLTVTTSEYLPYARARA